MSLSGAPDPSMSLGYGADDDDDAESEAGPCGVAAHGATLLPTVRHCCLLLLLASNSCPLPHTENPKLGPLLLPGQQPPRVQQRSPW